jgi:D-amino-acid oxidase
VRGPKIVVVGGGVVGLTTALRLADECSVSVVAERIGPASDSWKATAVWHVYLVPETGEVLSWAQRSLEKLSEIALTTPLAGVELVHGVELFRTTPFQVPSWSHIPRKFRMLTSKEVLSYNEFDDRGLSQSEIEDLRSHPVRWGYEIEAPAASMTRYLGWLESVATAKGVVFQRLRIDSLDELAGNGDLIVNCSGFGARELVGDRDFVPYKGQYFVLRTSESAPRAYVGDDDHPAGMAYVIPRLGEVMVGGCAEEGREDLVFTLDWVDTMRRAGLYVPWLRRRSPSDQARDPVVGVRPCRHGGVRLAIDRSSACVPVIHNYGHGGSGFSLSWGCAQAVLALVREL